MNSEHLFKELDVTDAVSSIGSVQLERKRKLARLLLELERLKYKPQGASVASGSIPAGNNSSANPAGSAANNNGINPVDSFTPSSAPTNETSGASDNSSSGQSAAAGTTPGSSAINSDSNTSGSASQAPEVTTPQLQNTIGRLQQMINSSNNVLQNPQSSTPDFNPTNDTNNASQDSLNRLIQNGRNISDSEANQQAADHQQWLANQVQKARSGPSPSDNNPPSDNTNSMGEPLEQAPEAALETSGGEAGGPGGGPGMAPGGPGGGAPPPPGP